MQTCSNKDCQWNILPLLCKDQHHQMFSFNTSLISCLKKAQLFKQTSDGTSGFKHYELFKQQQPRYLCQLLFCLSFNTNLKHKHLVSWYSIVRMLMASQHNNRCFPMLSTIQAVDLSLVGHQLPASLNLELGMKNWVQLVRNFKINLTSRERARPSWQKRRLILVGHSRTFTRDRFPSLCTKQHNDSRRPNSSQSWQGTVCWNNLQPD